MTYGKFVAEKFKKQYFDGRKKAWKVIPSWEKQPAEIYIVLRELKSKEAIEALLNSSWTRRLEARAKRAQQSGDKR